MASEHKDSDWLKQQLVSLLEDAASQEPKDHAACAKYADLLWKMLPRSSGRAQGDADIEAIRRRVRGEE